MSNKENPYRIESRPLNEVWKVYDVKGPGVLSLNHVHPREAERLAEHLNKAFQAGKAENKT